ncbi:hypothetical protein ACFO7T_00515 [Cupriavidus numazuensis]
MSKVFGMAAAALLAMALTGCAGGGARDGGSGSSITTYGTIDVGVSHTSK